ncbi:putative Sjoegren syndrome/scleroderma autoantigen 1-like [Apostichopus japonicus]|uniref:Putative Sjoegren syndrome/scleroderma autoantigen 1-like n=1 Tax=Stichopus japonicus TaxID=307972 RepID=A0A2G8K9N5_STIJA|nr:putative Sjoegren syndrome/scleroderma autoantigen 1-like [Apostichopus japonicus]
MNIQDETDEDDGWTPPTEAEMKVIVARRERADKISKLMGEYLLKGYTMLGISCEVCGELDTDLAKDDPALSTRAANSQVQEGEFNQSSSANNQEAQRAVFPIVEMDIETANGASASSSPHRSQQHAPHLTRQDMPKERGRKFTSQEREFLLESESILQGKLNWATQQLKEIDTVEGSIPLCELIKLARMR